MAPQNSPRPPALVQRTANRLIEDLKSSAGSVLPKTSELCRRYGVSRSTLNKAARILEKRGLLERGRGRPLRPRGAAACAPLPRALRVADQIAEALTCRIAAGSFRSGQALPKVTVLCGEFRTSRSTIVGVLAMLSARGLIHKEGKSWIVGRQISCGPGDRRTHPRNFILLVQPKAGYFSRFSGARTNAFRNAFIVEAARSNTLLLPCVVKDEREEYYYGLAFRSHRALREHIERRRHEYVGSLVLGLSGMYDDYHTLLETLISFERPVVAVDRKDSGIVEKTSKPALFRRCAYRESTFCRKALDHLYDLGHRRVAYVSRYTNDWDFTRELTLSAEAARQSEPFSLVTNSDAVARFKRMSRKDCADYLRSLHRKAPPHVRKTLSWLTKGRREQMFYRVYDLISHLLSVWPEFPPSPEAPERREFFELPVLRTKEDRELVERVRSIEGFFPQLLCDDITAMVATRDRLGTHMFKALERVGIAVPDEMSFVSFDNDIDVSILPVTTIDPGGSNLGYAACHSILGDVPVAYDKATCTLVAEPLVMERGSVRSVEYRNSV